MNRHVGPLSLVGLLVFCGGAIAQTEANKAVERRVFEEIWNQGNLDVADEVFAADALLHLSSEELRGPAAFKQYVAGYRAAFPDIHWIVDDQIAEGDLVVTRLTGTGTHQGELMGIPPTGLQVTATAIATVRIAEGMIQESWTSWDALGLMQQLGVMPPTRETFNWGEASGVTGDPGDPATNKASVQRMIEEGMNQGNLDVIEELFAANYVMHDPTSPMPVRGPEGFRQWAASMMAPFFTNSQITGDMVAEGDKVAVYWTWSGVHTGEFMGIPATGRQIVVAGTSIHRFADGQFVESWVSYDSLGMMQQLTAVGPVDPGGDGLVARYALDGDASDASGNGLDGAVVGEPGYVEGLTGFGMALDLDGVDDLVELGPFDVEGTITLAAWIRPDDFGINDARILSKAQEWGGNDHWWMLSTISETSLRFRLKTDDGEDTATLVSDPVLEAGVWAHVAASWDGSMMRIYKDGGEVASQEKGGTAVAVDPTISVAIGSQPSDAFASDPSHVAKFFDGLIDEVRIYNRALSAGEILFLTGYLADVTAPGDLVEGVPNDGDWPAAETPDLAIDDDVNTKYLHFKGDFEPDAGPTGFRVKPSVGRTVVTGVTFTTANDVPGRDPVAFELYGSNGSMDGPYTLIASRDIVDFVGVEEWPRFTKNATPIILTNDTAYTYYQVLITAIRGPVGGSVNSMQIAEVELMGMPLLPPPDPEVNKEVARRFFEEMWNNRDMDIVEELITADMKGHAPTGEFTGYEGERQTVLGTVAAFEDLQITIDEMIAEDDKVALLTSYHGTHTGTLMGQIPATGAEIRMTGGILFRFEGGKIAEAWSFADMLGLMQQIGVTTPPRPTPEDYSWSAASELTGDPGDPEVNKAMVARFVEEVWNRKNLDRIAELFHSETIGHNPPIDAMYQPDNLETFTQSIADYLAAYPDMDVTIHHTVAEGDKVLAYWTVNATHGGELMGIPPTGNPVTFSGHTMYRFADGQIVESWWAWDTLGMMQQISPPEIAEE